MPKSWLFIRYTNSGFVDVTRDELPSWLLHAWDVSASPDEMERELVKMGATRLEQIGFGDAGVDIWRHEGAWVAQHFTNNMVDTHIVVLDIADYMKFQAEWVSPIATKILLNDIAWKMFDEDDDSANMPAPGSRLN